MSARTDAAVRLAGFVDRALEHRGEVPDNQILDDLVAAYRRYGRPGSADWKDCESMVHDHPPGVPHTQEEVTS